MDPSPPPRPPDPDAIPAPAADLCLDFANTRMWRGTASPQETLHGLDDVMSWCAEHGILPPERGQQFASWRNDDAMAVFAETLAAREIIYGLFNAVAAGGTPAEANLQALSQALAATPARTTLVAAESGIAWRAPLAAPTASALLTPILWSAGDLLVSRRLDRVRQCANPQCLWLFLDDSKSGNRRWCSMSACGNRAKAHRHYLRRKRG
jgi:predicted RNA-binding Zn ribbon-like protein